MISVPAGAEGQAAGERWHDTGYVFTTELGAPLLPDHLTRRFIHLVKISGPTAVRQLGPRHRDTVHAESWLG
jgi:hypothetical protein